MNVPADTFEASGRVRSVLPRLTQDAIAGTLFFLVALSWSPLLPALLGVPLSLGLLASFAIFVVLVLSRRATPTPALLTMIAMICASLMFTLLSEATGVLLRTAPIALLVFMAYQTSRIPGMALRLCRMLTIFLTIGVMGAVIGQAYAFAGGSPLFSISNIDGRENSLYLTTMSNFQWLGVIRPAFIYDEPGAFSFLICATVALREALRMKRGPSLILLLGAITTFSITHWIITTIFLFVRFGALRVGLVLVVLASYLLPMMKSMEEFSFITERLEISDGQLSGDNRSDQLRNFAKIVDGRIFWFGDIECQSRPEKICEEHGDITSSPATPLYKAGILGLIPQFLVHAALAWAFVMGRGYRYSALTLSILLLQRPYFEIAGYGFITYLTVFVVVQGLVLQRRRRTSTPAPVALADLQPT